MITGGCPCPLGTSITDVDNVTCLESMGQIQKVVFQRLFKEDGSKNQFTSLNDILTLASWTALMSANDSTKTVITPYINAPTNEPGAARTFGGGNETVGGIEEIIGREPSPFTGVFRRIPQAVIKQLKQLQCEELGVFLIDEHGQIEAIKGTGTGVYEPIPIRALFIGDKGHGGLEAPDNNAIQWMFLPNWSDNAVIVKPTAFNPLTDLKNAA